MSTVTDLSSEDRLNNVKENLAGVREVIVKADTIVDGEYYALVGGSILTFLFGFVWLWDPSFLTFIAFIGFVANLVDYFGPKLLPYILDTNIWTEEKERKYHDACQTLVRFWNKVQNRLSVYMEWKNQKPLLNCVSTVVALMGLAWIGNRINNFLLAYLLTMGTFIFPKLQRQGFFQNEYFKSLIEKAQIEKKTAQLMETMSMKLGSLAKQGETWYKEKYTTIKTE